MAKQTTSTPGTKAASGSRPLRPKLTAPSAPTRRADRVGIASYVEQSWAELKKVTWPTPQETLNLTIAVIAMTVAVAIFLGIVDTAMSHVVQWLIG